MQKLEEIMRAEEAARHAVVSARERADGMVRDAEAEARALLDRERAETLERAMALRDEQLSAAQATARDIEQRTATQTRNALDASQGLMEAAVAAALERLQA
ncbi:MAG TPA: hypothetical protein VLA05_11045 [Coriobacteriia bacterium]|nr:hypothetical protein [Coriobacteriia bacterium]